MLWIECVHNTKINNFGSERALSVVRAQINVFDGFRKSAPDNRLSLSCSDLIQGRRFQRLILPSAPRLTCTLGGHSNFNRNIRSVRWVLVTKIRCQPIDWSLYQWDEVQETKSCLIGRNLHWKHVVNKAVRRKCSSGTDWSLFILCWLQDWQI